MKTRRMRLCGIIVVYAALIGSPLLAAETAGSKLLHVPPNLFDAGGPLGSLGIDECRIVLADGPGGSLLRVSKAMAGLGFRDIPFTVPPLEQDVVLGPLKTTLRLRIPGRDPADLQTTIQSTSVAMRINGANIELTALFEPEGPEMVGEYHAVDPDTGKAKWVHALFVEADDLTIAVSFPIQAQGANLSLGAPTVAAGFSFGVSGNGWAGIALDDTFAKDVVQASVERAVAKALSLDAYRSPLATAISAWLQAGPFQGMELREIKLQPTADGGLDLQAITTSDP